MKTIYSPQITELINRTFLELDNTARSIGCRAMLLYEYVDQLFIDTCGYEIDVTEFVLDPIGYLYDKQSEVGLFAYLECCDYINDRVQGMTCIDELDSVLIDENEDYNGFKARSPFDKYNPLDMADCSYYEAIDDF